MLFDNIQDDYSEYITKDDSRILSSSVVQAYKYVWEMGSAFMFSPEAQGVGGHMRRAAVAEFVLEAVRQNGLRFHPYIITTGSGRWKSKHLLLMADDQRIAFSINQVSGINSLPRKATYRDRLIERNHLQLAMDFDPSAESPYPVGWKYWTLTHGYRSEVPQFVGFGMPIARNKWGVRPVNILEQSSRQFFVSEETIEKKIGPKLKRQFEVQRSQES